MIWWGVILLIIVTLKPLQMESVELVRSATISAPTERFAPADPVQFGKMAQSESSLKEKKTRKPIVLVPVNVNVNCAGIEELCTIKGVGPVLAQRIIDYRKEHGPFSSVDELDSVKGIGAKTVEKLKIQKVWAGKK